MTLSAAKKCAYHKRSAAMYIPAGEDALLTTIRSRVAALTQNSIQRIGLYLRPIKANSSPRGSMGEPATSPNNASTLKPQAVNSFSRASGLKYCSQL